MRCQGADIFRASGRKQGHHRNIECRSQMTGSGIIGNQKAARRQRLDQCVEVFVNKKFPFFGIASLFYSLYEKPFLGAEKKTDLKPA